MRLIIALILLAALSSCATDQLAAPVISVAPKPPCLAMETYTPEEATKLAAEWAGLDPNSLTASKFIPGAITLRDENRAACGK